MNKMVITLLSKNIKTKIPVIKDHYWYDTNTGTWFHGRGGQMKFCYVSSQKKMVPYIFDLDEYAYKNNFEELEKISYNLSDKYDATILSKNYKKSIDIEIEEKHLNDISTDLYENNILWQN